MNNNDSKVLAFMPLRRQNTRTIAIKTFRCIKVSRQIMSLIDNYIQINWMFYIIFNRLQEGGLFQFVGIIFFLTSELRTESNILIHFPIKFYQFWLEVGRIILF